MTIEAVRTRPQRQSWLATFTGAACALGIALGATGASMVEDATAASPPPLPFGGAKIGGDFTLEDQFGNTRTEQDFDGRHTLIFFGYANCEAICTVALPRMADAVDQLGADSERYNPF